MAKRVVVFASALVAGPAAVHKEQIVPATLN